MGGDNLLLPPPRPGGSGAAGPPTERGMTGPGMERQDEGRGEVAAAWSGGRGREEPRERSPRRRGGDARPAHAPHPVTTASGTPPPPQRLFPPPHTPRTPHASRPHPSSPLLQGGRPWPSTARGRPDPGHHRARAGGGEGPDPPTHATRSATPHAPRHNPRRLPEPPSTPPARGGGGEEHSLLWALLPPRARNQAGHGQPAKPGLVNDPSAGSPTETLLRLLLPLDSQVRPSSQRSARAVGRPRRGRSEGLTKPSNR